MKPKDNSNRGAAQTRRTHKTKDDFLRWLREKDNRKERVRQRESSQAYNDISLALMVWADDGGANG